MGYDPPQDRRTIYLRRIFEYFNRLVFDIGEPHKFDYMPTHLSRSPQQARYNRSDAPSRSGTAFSALAGVVSRRAARDRASA